jgi:ribosome-binding ATPase YchF (GTP1/OBG family)
VHDELRAKDVERVQGIIEGLKKLIPRGLTKEQKEQVAAAEKVLAWLQEGKDIRSGDWNIAETDFLNESQVRRKYGATVWICQGRLCLGIWGSACKVKRSAKQHPACMAAVHFKV